MSDAIKINPAKKSELEFEVDIQGIDDQDVRVRFVIIGEDCNYMYNCELVEDSDTSWKVKLPVLSYLTDDTCEFKIEVIVDDYYFEPANGTLQLVSKPEVSSKVKVNQDRKPKVTTSFTVKQDDPKEKEKPTKTEKVVKEASGGDISGAYAPTNDLLNPEVEPLLKSKTAKVADHSIANDDAIDLDKLFSEITPGEGSSYPEPESEKTAREIASDLIKSVTGGITRPATKGTLFKRDKDGKVIDAGFESEDIKRKKRENAEKVRNIISSQ